MQKLVALYGYLPRTEGSEQILSTYEVEELAPFLSEGYKVVSITPMAQDARVCCMVLLEKPVKRPAGEIRVL